MTTLEPDILKIHAQLLDAARPISAALTDALVLIGPLTFPDREDNGIAHFLCRAIVGQQLSTKAARSIWARIEQAATTSNSTIPDCFDPNQAEAIRACGVSANKVRALQSVRAAAERGALCQHTLRALDHQSRSEQLLEIWGVGQWTCDMASIFYCKSPDVWPLGDVTVQKTFAGLIGRRKPTKAAEAFAPYRSYLALAMWRVADATP